MKIGWNVCFIQKLHDLAQRNHNNSLNIKKNRIMNDIITQFRFF